MVSHYHNLNQSRQYPRSPTQVYWWTYLHWWNFLKAEPAKTRGAKRALPQRSYVALTVLWVIWVLILGPVIADDDRQ